MLGECWVGDWNWDARDKSRNSNATRLGGTYLSPLASHSGQSYSATLDTPSSPLWAASKHATNTPPPSLHFRWAPRVGIIGCRYPMHIDVVRVECPCPCDQGKRAVKSKHQTNLT